MISFQQLSSVLLILLTVIIIIIIIIIIILHLRAKLEHASPVLHNIMIIDAINNGFIIIIIITKPATWGITLHAPQTVTTEQLQHYIQYKRGLFQVCNCKYPA